MEDFSRFSMFGLKLDHGKLESLIMDLRHADPVAFADKIKFFEKRRREINSEIQKRKKVEAERKAETFETETAVLAESEASSCLEVKLQSVESQTKINLEHPYTVELEVKPNLLQKCGHVIDSKKKVGLAICGQVELRDEDCSTEIQARKLSPKPENSHGKELEKLWGNSVSRLGVEVNRNQSKSVKLMWSAETPVVSQLENTACEEVKWTSGPRSMYDSIIELVSNRIRLLMDPSDAKTKTVVSPTSKIAYVLSARSSAQTNMSDYRSRWWVQGQRNDQRTNGQIGRRSEHLFGPSKYELESVPFRGGVPLLVSVFMVKDPDPALLKREFIALMKKAGVAPRPNVATVASASSSSRIAPSSSSSTPSSSPLAQVFRRFCPERVPPDKSTWTPSSSPSDKLRRHLCPF